MNSFVFLIERTAPGLYLLGALGILINLWTLWRTRRRLALAEFELEREMSARRQAAQITWVIGLVEVLAAIYAIANVVAPTLLNDVVPGTGVSSNNGPFLTSTPGQATLVNELGTPISNDALNGPLLTLTARPPDFGGPIQVTLVASPTPPNTIEPGPTPPVVGCTTPDAQLQVPVNNQVVFESLTVVGSAKVANFGLYRFELSGPSTGGAFAPYGGDKRAAVGSVGTLGQLSMTPFSFGKYLFRLVVFDNTNQLKASCTVTIYLRARPPTPTAISTAPGGTIQP